MIESQSETEKYFEWIIIAFTFCHLLVDKSLIYPLKYGHLLKQEREAWNTNVKLDTRPWNVKHECKVWCTTVKHKISAWSVIHDRETRNKGVKCDKRPLNEEDTIIVWNTIIRRETRTFWRWFVLTSDYRIRNVSLICPRYGFRKTFQ